MVSNTDRVSIEIDPDAEHPLDESDCEEYIGHAYTVDPVVLQSYPPKERRTCQCCGKRQTRTRGPGAWS